MRRLRLMWLAIIPLFLTGTAFIALANAAPATQDAPTVLGACQVGLTKAADPDSVDLGDTLQVTMVMTHTCPSVQPPLDIIFLVDISNSMTTGGGRQRADVCGGGNTDPGADPFPTEPGKGPTQDPRTPNPDPTEPGGGPAEPTSVISNTVPTRPPSLPVIGTPPGADVTPPGSISDPPTKPTKVLTPDPRTPTAKPTRPGGSDPSDPTPGSNLPPGYDRGPTEEPGNVNLIKDVAKFVRDFVREPAVQQAADDGMLRVGLIAFESRPHTIASLTNRLTRINSAVSRLDNLPHGTTNISLGFYRANQIMIKGRQTGDIVNRAIVIISDGKFDQKSVRGLRKREGVQHFAVAMGMDPNLAYMNDIVSEREYLLDQRDYQKFYEYYETVMQPGVSVAMDKAVVRDELADNMRYVDGSAAPTATVGGGIIEWLFEPPAPRITMTYEVEPLTAGLWPISKKAEVNWTDSVDRTGTGAFPQVQVEVIGPTATPSPTPTATDVPTETPEPTYTPTPVPSDVYLPIAYAAWPPPPPTPTVKPPCIPSEATVDIGLIVDTSDSMLNQIPSGGSKLDAAIEASQVLVDLLKLDGRDQVTVIGFNSEAHVVTPLTGDKARIDAALQDLRNTQARGTKMHLGLQAAHDQLTGPDAKDENNASIVLVTDGRHEGPADEVRQIANLIKSKGIAIVTVGLGEDVDRALLEEIASDPSQFYYSPDAEGLEEIYRRIADYIPCP